MKLHIILIGILLPMSILPCVVNASSTNHNMSLQPLSDFDIWIDEGGWYAYWYDGLTTSHTIYVDFEVTSGGDIDFFICDDEEFAIWDSGGTAWVYELSENVGSLSVEFQVQSAGRWYIVFDNDAIFTRKHIEGYHGLSPQSNPQTPTFDAGALMLIVLLVGVVAVAIVGAAKAVSGQQSGPSSVDVHQPVQTEIVYHATPAKTEKQMFCPYCGASRAPPEAPFCSNCGKQFENAPDIR